MNRTSNLTITISGIIEYIFIAALAVMWLLLLSMKNTADPAGGAVFSILTLGATIVAVPIILICAIIVVISYLIHNKKYRNIPFTLFQKISFILSLVILSFSILHVGFGYFNFLLK